jgi:hypothetical protein
MASRRHRHVKSNRMCFCDATLIEPEHFEIGRGVAALPPDRILRKIDRLASIVAALRDEVAVGLVGERV